MGICMKAQWKLILKRLKKPSVVLSIVSQIVSVLILFKAPIDAELIKGIAAALCSILTLLGIMSNPDTQKQGYGDDVYTCSGCGENTQHAMVNGQLVCCRCGTVLENHQE